ncbi:5'-methylthioadenosine/adenosylhomocysteine nucleosidase [Gaoshiqia sediminis]|uniref:adenosylhomocysteine nucleosidase n=1 Tax=Gaoshiqia sediminis TaxID=2986998 RepID=A0AA41Y5H0_9BACT|nr:5'-methylthioadenosine/adenosylhomocysteine nucleosidase [Gaoshiqia sediminis]MCW0483779.1 5'-methylthioadenosine/adenosylhomocysteine nucleosidase [Gaoshiqia sediminis]
MKTGLIGAMREEILLLKHDIENMKIDQLGSREFYSGTIGGKEVVMCLSGWGKVAAASTATSLINLYGVDQLVFIGLAGSMQPHLHIGDIVVADRLIQHDVDLSLLDGFQDVDPPFWKSFHFEVLPDAGKRALDAVKQFTVNLKEKKYPGISNTYQPQIYTGAIGTGDQFVASPEGKTRISERFPEVLCTEMEGAAIAQVAADYQLPCSVIRIISDKADENAHQAFAKFLFENISRISVEIARLMFV